MTDIHLQSIKQRYGIIGRSEALDRALSTALRVANTDLSVLITGESGVGKEIFSRIIHDNSARKHNGFIAINCGAIPEGTINSELFGHEKGAFTGATGDRKGYFESYDKGTIFLDEIGEMPLDTQTYLLRVLETGEFIRVGSSKVQRTDVRIIAATNVKLEENIRKNKFREDLFYRLSTVPIQLPPLRERREDIILLFRKFAVDFAEKYRSQPIQPDDGARLILENYSWPGNIRELKNVAEQLSVLTESRQLDAASLGKLMPHLLNRNLPSAASATEAGAGMQEREILYKLLFDMKGDLNDLKSLVYELIRGNNLRVPDTMATRSFALPLSMGRSDNAMPAAAPIGLPSQPSLAETTANEEATPGLGEIRPILLDGKDSFYSTEIVEDNLSIIDNEKDLIRKALCKYHGRRKDAAQELGISERTLYRKIKEYDINS